MSMFAPFAQPQGSVSNGGPPAAAPDLSSVKLVEAVQNNWAYEKIVLVLQASPDGINEKGKLKQNDC